MQFYKKRDFGELISSTFDFMKIYGRNYFKNFLILNGLTLILIMLVAFIGFGEFFQQMFGSNLGNETYFLEEYFYYNRELLIVLSIISIILFLVLSLVAYSYPVLYMKRVSETGEQKITLEQMAMDLKNIIGRFLIFMLGMLFIFLPVGIILLFLSTALMFILIGFALIFIILPVYMNLMNFTLFHFYHTKTGFFASIQFALNAMFSKNFWKYLGSVAVIYIIIQVVSTVFTMIPMMIFFASEFVMISQVDEENLAFLIFILGTYAISFLASFILVNLIYINTGFMYYDARTDLHRQIQMEEIQSLGKNEI